MPEGTGLAWWLGTLVGLVIGLIIKDAASALGKRLLKRVTPGFTRREAEAQKTGELEAIRKDLHNLVHQTAQLTTVQSQIQAEINGNLWTQQMVWQQKREAYSNILRCSQELQDRLVHLMSTRRLFDQVQQQGLPERNLPSDLVARTQETGEAHRIFLDAVTEAQLFVDGIQQLRGEYIEYMGRIESGAANDQDKVAQKTTVLGKWTGDLIRMARQDLGVKTS